MMKCSSLLACIYTLAPDQLRSKDGYLSALDVLMGECDKRPIERGFVLSLKDDFLAFIRLQSVEKREKRMMQNMRYKQRRNVCSSTVMSGRLLVSGFVRGECTRLAEAFAAVQAFEGLF